MHWHHLTSLIINRIIIHKVKIVNASMHNHHGLLYAVSLMRYVLSIVASRIQIGILY
jgi:hypothetical protein